MPFPSFAKAIFSNHLVGNKLIAITLHAIGAFRREMSQAGTVTTPHTSVNTLSSTKPRYEGAAPSIKSGEGRGNYHLLIYLIYVIFDQSRLV